METFFQFFEKQTGYKKGQAQEVIRIVSGYLAENYKDEFTLMFQYFLNQLYEHKDRNKEITTA